MDFPLASIIIPVFNRANLIERCLDSIYSQSFRPLEIIVVDNNSTDQSLSTVARWMENHPDQDIAYKPGVCTVQGASAARAFGQGMATANYLFFFDSDDTMRPDLIKDAMDVFINYPGTDIVGWRVLFHMLNGKTRISHMWMPSQSLDYHLIHSVLRTQGYAATREALLHSGGWQPGFPVWDDWELGVRLLLTNPNIKVLNKVEADVWSQEESITGVAFFPKAGQWERILDIAEKNAIESSHHRREHIARLIAYRRAILAAFYKREGYSELASDLLQKALASPYLSFIQRQAIKTAYFQTANGIRGAFSIVGPLL